MMTRSVLRKRNTYRAVAYRRGTAGTTHVRHDRVC